MGTPEFSYNRVITCGQLIEQLRLLKGSPNPFRDLRLARKIEGEFPGNETIESEEFGKLCKRLKEYERWALGFSIYRMRADGSS